VLGKQPADVKDRHLGDVIGVCLRVNDREVVAAL